MEPQTSVQASPDAKRTRPRYSEFAIASLVIGILTFVNLVNLEKAIAAVVFGVLALRRMGPEGQGGRKMAMAGVILGVVGIVLSTYFTIRFLPRVAEMQRQGQMTMPAPAP